MKGIGEPRWCPRCEAITRGTYKADCDGERLVCSRCGHSVRVDESMEETLAKEQMSRWSDPPEPEEPPDAQQLTAKAPDRKPHLAFSTDGVRIVAKRSDGGGASYPIAYWATVEYVSGTDALCEPIWSRVGEARVRVSHDGDLTYQGIPGSNSPMLAALNAFVADELTAYVWYNEPLCQRRQRRNT